MEQAAGRPRRARCDEDKRRVEFFATPDHGPVQRRRITSPPTPRRWNVRWRPMAKAWSRGSKTSCMTSRSSNDGDEFLPTLADPEAFEVGENIATTEGRGGLPQPDAGADPVRAHDREGAQDIPLVIFPPWINKFYILDLKPQKQPDQVDRGPGLYTLRGVLEVNPDASYYAETWARDLHRGGLSGGDRTRRSAITGEKQVNAVGYCIAGTTLSGDFRADGQTRRSSR